MIIVDLIAWPIFVYLACFVLYRIIIIFNSSKGRFADIEKRDYEQKYARKLTVLIYSHNNSSKVKSLVELFSKQNYDKENFSENSMRWVVDFVDNLLYLRWQEAIKDLHEARDPMEQRFFDEQTEVDKNFEELFKKNPKKAKEYITSLTIERQNEALKMFQDLRITLITKYTNNKQGI